MLRSPGVCIILVSALVICGPVSGAGFSGLWNIRYDYISISEEASLPDGCVLAVFQNGSDLFGPCMSEEPYPWNGVFLGTNDSDFFELTITSKSPLMNTRFRGQSIDGILQGYFFGATEDGVAYFGTFLGSLMNPNPGLFEPARVAQESYLLTEVVEAEPESVVLEEAPVAVSEDKFYKISYTRDTIYPRPVI